MCLRVPSLAALVLSLSLQTPVLGQYDPVGEALRPDPPVANNLHYVAYHRGYLYATDNSRRLFVFDVRDLKPGAPFRTYTGPATPREGFAELMIRVGGYLYGAAQWTVLKVYDLSEPGNPVFVRNVQLIPEDSRIRGYAIDGHLLFVVGRETVQAFDVADPSLPVHAGTLALPEGFSGWSVAAGRTHIYVGALDSSAGQYRLFVVDRSGEALTLIHTIEVEDVAYHLFVHGNYLIESRSSSLVLWDIGNPTRPVALDSAQASGRVCTQIGDVYVTNGRIFRASGGVLTQIGGYLTNGGQHDGVPHGSVFSHGMIFQTQSDRVRIIGAPPSLAFPQFVTGEHGGIRNRTRVVLRNNGDQPSEGHLLFQDPSGATLDVSTPGIDGGRLDFLLPPWGSLNLQTSGQGSLKSGSIEVRTDGAGTNQLDGAVAFELFERFVSVPASVPRNAYQAYVTVTPAENTGVAVFNPSFADAAILEFLLLDDAGEPVAPPVEINLAPRQRQALFVTEAPLFPGFFSALAGDFSGTLNVSSRNGALFSLTSLVQKTADGALVVMPVSERVHPPPG